MESLFLENKLGGQETHELATNIGQCVTNSQSPGWTAKNAARDLMRRCLKKWLASSLCGWHNHLGWQGANTKTVTRGIQNVGSKFQKLSHWDFIDSQLDLKRPISTIYSVPLFLTSNFKLDWLHVVDLGVTLACLGNCFHYLLPRLGKNASEQLPQLLLLIKQYYMVHDIKDGINNLTAGMFRASPSVSPKLKVKGAEARSLVRFAKELVEKYCNESQAFDSGVKWVVICLNQCHDLGLHNDSFHAPSCQKGCAIFLLQYKSLEEAMGTDSLLWILKPKFHMMFELAQTRDCPAKWTGSIEMKKQGEHWPEWQGLVVASRIPGVLAVDVCKGFAVTTMCLSCEKMQCSKTCSNKAWVKHVGGKARCPKKRDRFQTIKNIL